MTWRALPCVVVHGDGHDTGSVDGRWCISQIINVFLVTTIYGTLVDTVSEIVEDPEKTFTLLGEGLPKVSTGPVVSGGLWIARRYRAGGRCPVRSRHPGNGTRLQGPFLSTSPHCLCRLERLVMACAGIGADGLALRTCPASSFRGARATAGEMTCFELAGKIPYGAMVPRCCVHVSGLVTGVDW